MPTLVETIRGAIAGLLLERPAAKIDLLEFVNTLTISADAIDARAAAARDTSKAQIVLRHITGIERWGQNRLRVFLGQPLTLDEYDGYRPANNLTTEQQREEFRKTRAQTVALVQQLAAANIAKDSHVRHNQFGPISLRGWLRYLEFHARQESKKIAVAK